MASDASYLNFILEQLSELDSVTYRSMMGEYLLYYKGRLFGGIYDNRFLVKAVDAAERYMRTIRFETPYPGAKEMLLVDDVDSKAYLTGLLNAMLPELPAGKPKKPRVKK